MLDGSVVEQAWRARLLHELMRTQQENEAEDAADVGALETTVKSRGGAPVQASFDLLEAGSADRRCDGELATEPDQLAALLNCALCQKAIGECALVSAKAGTVETVFALDVCRTMTQLTDYSLKVQLLNVSRHITWMALGVSRERDVEAECEQLWERL
ncbi:MAG: hypothetical protein ACPGOV_03790 [Magnetovibrionaceae bacterium]